ncbi:DUF6022 family protein [Evansella halocellulosilytica]|uniref:DUF6022 family protein n=1 Tax=Evansella halocellulosilytica TaxID=2011013 RepID=UPI000BB97679|nr:DUF6022 family protein [Evansella halocellulosilytica]
MKISLADEISRNGRTIEVFTDYLQKYIDQHWVKVWERDLQDLERVYANGGDKAYGLFMSKLFRPLAVECRETGFIPKPILPGDFSQSEEHWGPWEERERRFWTVIHENDNPIGTVVTSFFHDHTRLRVPKPPQLCSLKQTDHSDVSKLIMFEDFVGSGKEELNE